jgi:hypothetical protein
VAQGVSDDVGAGLRTTVNIDPHKRTFMVNPFAWLNGFRRQARSAYSDGHGGFWVVTGSREVAEVLHSPEVSCSGHGLTHPWNPAVPNIRLNQLADLRRRGSRPVKWARTWRTLEAFVPTLALSTTSWSGCDPYYTVVERLG